MALLCNFPIDFSVVKKWMGAPAFNIVRWATLLVVLIFVASCSHGSFDRFMDHPILSWLPLDEWGIVGNGTENAINPTSQFPNNECFKVARERIEFLDKTELSDVDLHKIFALNYQECVKVEN